jgi:enoyl-CoA hydratase
LISQLQRAPKNAAHVQREEAVDGTTGNGRREIARGLAGRGEGVSVRIEGAAGMVTLGRPQALNALTTAMRAEIARALAAWARDPQVYAVVVESGTEGIFCAGGDVREVVHPARADMVAARDSLAAEYALNWQLECFTKPTVSLIDGLVVGAGVGLTLYGTHRVAGARYRFAMPETGIGLFPDDGVSWAFARMPHEIGMYLALTGKVIASADAYRLGLVTHCIPAERFARIRAAVSDADPVDPVLDGMHQDPGPGELEEVEAVIARCFSADSVEEILARLRAERGAAETWAQATLRDLSGRSPTSLKVTHRQVRLARGLDLRQALIQDYRLACRFLEGFDFFEGVRAALVDRDHVPGWRPARLEEVSASAVEAYFVPMGAGELSLASRQELQALRP